MERRHIYPTRQLAILIAAGLISEAVYLLLFARVLPVSMVNAPQPWSFVEFVFPERPEALALLFALAPLFVPYLVAWRMADRLHNTRLTIAIALGFSVIYGVTMLATYPGTSDDIFQYISQGRVLTNYHANPFVTAPRDFPSDMVMPYLHWVNESSTYGPLWVLLSGAASFLAGNNLLLNLLTFKAMAVLFYLLTTLVIYCVVRKDRPEAALSSLILFAWNPLVVFEVGANGHNDTVMAFFTVASVYALARGRIRTSFVLLMSSVLIKFITLVMFPAFVLAWITQGVECRARAREAIGGFILAGFLAVALFAPFWQGSQTIGPLKRGGLYTSSPATIISAALPRLGFPQSFSDTLPLALGLVFAIIAIPLTLRLRGRMNDLPTICFDLLLAYFMIAATWFHPWYLITLVGLAAVVADRRRKLLAVVFSASSLLRYLVMALFGARFGLLQVEALMTLAIFLPPILFILFLRLSGVLREKGRMRWPFAIRVGKIT